jgi:hypothetical protein
MTGKSPNVPRVNGDDEGSRRDDARARVRHKNFYKKIPQEFLTETSSDEQELDLFYLMRLPQSDRELT